MKTLYIADEKRKFVCSVQCPDDTRKENYSEYNVGVYITDAIPPRKSRPMEFILYNPDSDTWVYDYIKEPDYNEFEETIINNQVEYFKRSRSLFNIDIFSSQNIFYDTFKIFNRFDNFSRNCRPYAKRKKTVTVFIPCYNKAEYIVETVQSVVKQTILPEKIYIYLMDEKSIEMKDTLLTMSNIIEVEIGENKSIPEVRNYFASICTTTDLIHLDADDILEEHCIDWLLSYDADVVLGKAILFENVIENLKPEYFEYTKNTLSNLHFGNTFGLYSAEVCKNIKFDELILCSVCGIDFKLKVYESDYSLELSTQAIMYYRRLTGQKIIDTSAFYKTFNYDSYLICQRNHVNTYIKHHELIWDQLSDKERHWLKCIKFILTTETIDDSCKAMMGYCRTVINNRLMNELTFENLIDLTQAAIYPEMIKYEIIVALNKLSDEMVRTLSNENPNFLVKFNILKSINTETLDSVKMFEIFDKYSDVLKIIGAKYKKNKKLIHRVNFGNFISGILEAYRPTYNFLKETLNIENISVD